MLNNLINAQRICWKPIFCWLLLSFAVSGCNREYDDKTPSPPGYLLNRPVTLKLPPALDEISGIVYYPKDRSVLAINDEIGWLYKVFLRDSRHLTKWKYSKGADFEDLVLVDSTFYVLKSNGGLIQFKVISPEQVETKEFPYPFEGKNEFEILYHDSLSKQLVLLCKDCEMDNKNSLTAVAFHLDSLKFSSTPPYIINVREIENLLEEKKFRFKPSAAAIHPVTKELFIVSSVNKVLVVADRRGRPKKVFKINPKLFKQPEGITFSPHGDMLVSNESADIGAANIMTLLKFRPTISWSWVSTSVFVL